MRTIWTLFICSLWLCHYASEATPAGASDVGPAAVLTASGAEGAVDLPNTNTNTNTNSDDGTDNDDSWFNYDGRIIGGLPTSIRNFPYQVSLQYKGQHICGGAIVRPNVIITAAHCVDQTMKVSSFKVRAGSSQHAYGGQLRAVQRILRHEGYSSATYNLDVALLQLERDLVYTQAVQPVVLASRNAVLSAQAKLFVSGWGLTSETGYVSAMLNYVDVQLIRQETCEQNYKYVVPITTEMFCAGYSAGGKDSCQGDSGGPLVSYYHGAATLYGIVSWGVGCAQKEYPGVYAKVAALRPWIDAQLVDIAKRSGKLY
ncbi:trypsin beta [Zeugodacus cucurbitae]|uniref:Trypsin-4 n=1 Tax=Zeugodacus cucurbitae TaxID=28588 RepID=A0A0A1WZ93_ZEUCU|nr:trypsin beta [Zeugodacus cucurbitae]